MSVRVTAPYVTARVKDLAGAWVQRGFNEGAFIEGETHPDDLKHLLGRGMVEKEAEVEPVAEPDKPKATHTRRAPADDK